MNQHPQHKICPRCSVSFICKVDDIQHCQCYGILLPPVAEKYIKEKYADCLCHDCLLELMELPDFSKE
jgi:hypothetical protein